MPLVFYKGHGNLPSQGVVFFATPQTTLPSTLPNGIPNGRNTHENTSNFLTIFH
jgi:hypothetical protein